MYGIVSEIQFWFEGLLYCVVSSANHTKPLKNPFNPKHGSSRSREPPYEKRLTKFYDANKFELQLQQPIVPK